VRRAVAEHHFLVEIDGLRDDGPDPSLFRFFALVVAANSVQPVARHTHYPSADDDKGNRMASG
jgi:hypothetical protein